MCLNIRQKLWLFRAENYIYITVCAWEALVYWIERLLVVLAHPGLIPTWNGSANYFYLSGSWMEPDTIIVKFENVGSKWNPSLR